MKGKNVLLMLMMLSALGSGATNVDWGTYFGGMQRENGIAICTDKWGNVYTVGNTASSSNIATLGSMQAIYGGDVGSTGIPGDAFIAKYNNAGRLLWSTYFGGSDDEGATGIGCDTTGRLYICGWTRSTNGIATVSSHQQFLMGTSDAFVLCLDTAGNRIWSTYYGGSGDENSNVSGAIHVTPGGDLFLTGKTSSPNNITTAGSHQPSLSPSGGNAYIAKFDRNGQRIWSTYFGGGTANGEETEGTAICVRGNTLLITGGTLSTSGLATSTGHQLAFGGGTRDAFIASFDTSGRINWSSYFGGATYDFGTAVFVNDNSIFLSGNTNSSNGISTSGSHQQSIAGNQDLFLARFNLNGSLIWSTYLGGNVLDASGRAIVGDRIGNIYITGNAASATGISTTNSIQPVIGGGQDGILAKFNSSGSLIWATYYGGTGADYGVGLASNTEGKLYLCGRTVSATSIATSGAQQASLGGDNDAFISTINDCSQVPKPDTIIGPSFICNGTTNIYRSSRVAGATSYTWIMPNGWFGASSTDTMSSVTGTTSGWLKVVANGICSSSDTQRIFVSVSKRPVISPIAASACSGDSLLLISSNVSSNLIWFRNGASVQNATDSALFVNQSGSYVIISSEMGCRDTSVAAIVTVHPLPVPGNIARSGNTLSLAGSFTTYQWNFNGTPITGAVNSTFQFSVNGDYSVTVADSNGCRATSPIYNTNSSSVSNAEQVNIILYPTLVTQGTLFIEAKTGGIVSIYSTDGKSLLHQDLKSGKMALDIGSLSPGIYYLRITGSNYTLPFHKKFTIQ